MSGADQWAQEIQNIQRIVSNKPQHQVENPEWSLQKTKTQHSLWKR